MPEKTPKKRQVVLLVEDNEERQVEYRALLAKLEVDVLSARTHEEARARYYEASDVIDLIILDDCVEQPGFTYDAEAFLAFLENPDTAAPPYAGLILVCSDDPDLRAILRAEDLVVTPKGREAVNAIMRIFDIPPLDTDPIPIDLDE